MPFLIPHPSLRASRTAPSPAASGAPQPRARRPKTIVALWLLFVVGCVSAGGAAGTKTLTDTETGAGQSKSADERIEAAGLRDPAVESVLIKSGDPATTAAAAADLTKRLKAGDEVAPSRPGRRAELSTNGGNIVLVQSHLRGDPDDAGDSPTA